MALDNLGCTRARQKVRYKSNDGKQQKQVDQGAGNMEHQKAASPQNEQQQRNYEKRSESHFRLRKF
jgi:hypothetical protein